ncbi:MAG: efflux RND transporter permease subunit [Dinoroseobacter sp.]|nr:efflux RND transporter permease subunit [Dinoroseobacter sp.]
MLDGLLSYFTRHRTAANLLLVLLIGMGAALAPQMRAQFFPDVISDEIDVEVRWDGAGPEDVDGAIIEVLEPDLLAIDGVVRASSVAREGRASIELEFEPDWDMARAANDVQAVFDSVTTLPEDSDDPEVRRSTWRDRVTDVVVHGPVSVDQLARFADEYVLQLFRAGVTRATIRGIAAPETLVEVPTVALLQHDLSMAEIAEAISAEASSNPSGDIASGSARVRTGSETRTAEAISSIVLRTQEDGSLLTIGDVAVVTVGAVDRERAYFVDDNRAISIRIDRNEQGDAIGIQRVVEEVAAEFERSLPEGVRVELIRTRAEAINARLNILLDNGLLGLSLVVGLLFLFLNARTAFWVAAGIPVAMLTAVGLMYLGGLTLNMVSLFALIITLGIVVDDAIVVGEHADYRARTLGEPPILAAENAAKRMSAPVFSATITTIIAFFALTVIDGSFGSLIADIPFTVIAVLLASLVECFLILPNHMAHALAHSAKEHWYDWPSRQVNRGLDWVRAYPFRRLLRLIIWARYPVFAGAIVLLLAQAALFVRGDVTWRFFNAPERGSVSGNFSMLPGATREDTLEMMRAVQSATEALGARYEAEYGVNPLAFVMAEIGGMTGRRLSGADTKEPDQLGSIAIELIEADLRPYSSFDFVAELQQTVPRHPKLETLSFRGWRSGPGGDSLSIQLFGADAARLKEAAEALKDALSAFPEASALEDNLSYDKEELLLELTPTGAQLGISVEDMARVLRNRLNGIEAATYPQGPRTASIRVELPSRDLGADFLDRTLLRTASGEYVPLADVVSVNSREGFSRIRRENGLRIVTVSGDLDQDDASRAAEIRRTIDTEILPRLESDFGVGWRNTGLAEQEQDFLTDAMIGYLICLMGIFLCLAWIFSSWTRPIVVMIIIPFGFIGAIWGHFVWDVPVSMFSVVGLIGMAGIIINDSIVLITRIEEYRKDRSLNKAIVDGTCDRLRPVLLTTLTTVLGLAPLLYEGSQQAQFLRPTVITLVYGLGFGMLLVLVLVPAVMAMQNDIGRQFDALRRSLFRPFKSGTSGWATALSTVGVAVAFVGTIGMAALSGTVPASIARLLPDMLEPPQAALFGFLILSGVSIFLGWLAGAAARALRS